MKVLDLLSSEYAVIVYLLMYYYVNVSVLLCRVAVWCLYMYFWVIGNMFYCTDYDLFLLIMNRGKLIYKLALFVYLFFFQPCIKLQMY